MLCGVKAMSSGNGDSELLMIIIKPLREVDDIQDVVDLGKVTDKYCIISSQISRR